MAKSLYRIENIRLAELLRGLREDAGMVQSAVATKLGRNQTYVSNVELAIKRLDLVELRDYCRALDIPLRDLVKRWETSISESGKAKRAGRKSIRK